MKNSITVILFSSLVVMSAREVCLSIKANNPIVLNDSAKIGFYVEAHRSKSLPEPKQVRKVMDHFIEPDKIVPVPNKHFLKRMLRLPIIKINEK